MTTNDSFSSTRDSGPGGGRETWVSETGGAGDRSRYSTYWTTGVYTSSRTHGTCSSPRGSGVGTGRGSSPTTAQTSPREGLEIGPPWKGPGELGPGQEPPVGRYDGGYVSGESGRPPGETGPATGPSGFLPGSYPSPQSLGVR